MQRAVWGSALLAGVAALAVVAALPPAGAGFVQARAKHAAQPARQVVRIGYQKYGTLNILKATGGLEKRLKALGYQVQWIEFPGGPQLLEALNAGSIDIGHTGEAPPVFAQAAGVPFVYLAHEQPSPASEGILVPAHSQIKTISDLKGKRIALNKGSNVHYLLVRVLQKAGLKYSDIHPVYLAPADARAAFERGSVDAWVIWDPYYAAAETADHARVLIDGKGLVANQEFYLAQRTFALQHPDVIKALLAEIEQEDAWIRTHRHETAKLLSPQLGIDVQSLDLAANRRNYGVEPITPAVVQQQQVIADTFYQLHLIPKPIHVKDDTYAVPWPNQAAAAKGAAR
ncbi:sulfonate ABC transporter substrate-binding protein [Alicyclobacillus cellulosilyticus]|uniref:Putative aliphatic sulfonates-binding protein n=2 Tax=Alicyclobacillus cellulosilyticus TaxID=1003997 RepID=A0A917NLJ8_9BACL|nr:sulfonate ABC transporter substrate-binding protein [Alicyclobacillus cellulosilyticus]GGJ09726.1 sulfonate ABC transporter substrate-binding protein [Alicyclobacillus cellulosilyticus]